MGKYPQVLTSLLYMPQNSIYLDVIQLQKTTVTKLWKWIPGLLRLFGFIGGVQKIRIFGDTPFYEKE